MASWARACCCTQCQREHGRACLRWQIPLLDRAEREVVGIEAAEIVRGRHEIRAIAKTCACLIGGGAIGEQVLDVGAVTTLAKLPSLDELRSSLLGLLNAPATRIATVLQAPGAQLARVMNAYATKDEAA